MFSTNFIDLGKYVVVLDLKSDFVTCLPLISVCTHILLLPNILNNYLDIRRTPFLFL